MANLNEVKKYHFIYKTTNLLNDKYYVGMHSTNNLKDDYLGSGLRLRRSIRKYGIENFKLEILEFLSDRVSLVEREKQLVNQSLLKDEMCMNLKPGGTGGFCNDTHKKKYHAAGGKAVMVLLGKRHIERIKADLEYREKVVSKLKGLQTWLGKTHTSKSKEKIGAANSVKQKGEANSQFGTCWITNGIENKKIKKTDLIPKGWKIGRMIK